MDNNYAIYVHIPFCKARCGYCAFSSCVNFHLCEKYFDVLCNEIRRTKAVPQCKVKTIFWGGGTPSAVEVKYLSRLYTTLAEKFDLSALEEFSVECNPESVTGDLLKFLKSINVNRLSLGLQSANDETLKRVGRLHDYATFLRALNLAEQYGFYNVNADLILGLPESARQFYNTVEQVTQLPLQHLSLYALEIHEGTEFEKLCKSFPHSDDELADMYDYAKAAFERAGFLRYEVSNFAKVGYECKHNLTYWTENRYFGFGAAASGFVGNIRYGNAFDIGKYIDSNGRDLEYKEKISLKEEMFEYVMLALRLQNGFSLADFKNRYGADFCKCFPACDRLIDDGFFVKSCGRVFVRDDKFYVLNSILTELMPD